MSTSKKVISFMPSRKPPPAPAKGSQGKATGHVHISGAKGLRIKTSESASMKAGLKLQAPGTAATDALKSASPLQNQLSSIAIKLNKFSEPPPKIRKKDKTREATLMEEPDIEDGPKLNLPEINLTGSLLEHLMKDIENSHPGQPFEEADRLLSRGAITALEKARQFNYMNLEINLEAARLLVSCAQVAFKRGEWQSGAILLESALEKFSKDNPPQTLEWLLQASQAWLNMGKRHRAAHLQKEANELTLFYLAKNAEDTVWLHHLSSTHHLKAKVHQAMAEMDEAIAAEKESLEILDHLVHQPIKLHEQHDWQRDWLNGHCDLGFMQAQHGRWDDALKTHLKGLKWHLDHEIGPSDRLKWRPEVANTYLESSLDYWTLGRFSESRDHLRQAITILDRLLLAQPDSLALQRLRVKQLIHAARIEMLDDPGPSETILKSYKEALEIAQEMSADDAKNVQTYAQLWQVHHQLGEFHRLQGELSQSQHHHRINIRLAEKMLEFDDADSRWKHLLAVSQRQTALILRSLGLREECDDLYHESGQLFEQLYYEDDEHTEWNLDYIRHQAQLSNLAYDINESVQALHHNQQALQHIERLLRITPTNIEWQREKVRLMLQAGNLYLDQQDHASASASYEQSLYLIDQLLRIHPQALTWQHDRIEICICLGHALQNLGQWVAAIENYDLGEQSVQSLRDRHADYLPWHQTHALLLEHRAQLDLQQGDTEEAVKRYRRSLELRAKAKGKDDCPVQWRLDWAITSCRLSRIETTDSTDFERSELEKQGMALLGFLQKHKRISPVQQKNLSTSV